MQTDIIKENQLQKKLINKSERNNKILNQLKQQYEQLKKLFEAPRLHVSNHFSDLRSQVDIAFIKMNQNEPNLEIKHKLNDTWFQMIEKINIFETECLKTRGSNTFSNDFAQEIKEKIGLIDIILKDLNNQVIVEETLLAFPSNNKLNEEIENDEDSFNQISNFIYEEFHKIEKLLFLNRTLFFLDKENWINTSLFDKMNVKTTFGKFILVQNEYFGNQSMSLFKKLVFSYFYTVKVFLRSEYEHLYSGILIM